MAQLKLKLLIMKILLVNEIPYKTLMSAKFFRSRFEKIDGFVRVYCGSKYLILFGGENYDFIYNRFRYLTGEKSSIIYVIYNNINKISKLCKNQC